MAAKIYTKTGDSGTTSLLEGRRVSKNDARLEAYGSLDELNSYLGLCRQALETSKLPDREALVAQFTRLQSALFCIGSLLAAETEKMQQKLPKMDPLEIEAMEKAIDEWDSELPALKNFILPGGQDLACHLHFARSLCRRAERVTVDILQKQNAHAELVFINRLSDFLFVAARWANFQYKRGDVLWSPGKP